MTAHTKAQVKAHVKAHLEAIYAMEVEYAAARQTVGLEFLECTSAAQARSIWNRLAPAERGDLLLYVSSEPGLHDSFIGKALLDLRDTDPLEARYVALAQARVLCAKQTAVQACEDTTALKFLEFASGAQSRNLWNRLDPSERFALLALIETDPTLRTSIIGKALLRMPQVEIVPVLEPNGP